jgi:hypothetical protein
MTKAESATRDWGDTLRIRAEVAVSGNRTFSGFLHLLPFASIHLGPETPEDVLNREEAFFALTDDQEHTIFIAKEQVLLVTIEAASWAGDPDRFLVVRTIPLRVELCDGSVHSGIVSSELPPTRTRAIDFLNSAPGFFALWTDEAVRYINRANVRVVSPTS